MSALILPAAGVLAGAVAYLLIRAATRAARAIARSFTAARQTTAWARSTALDTEAAALNAHIDELELLDALWALPATTNRNTRKETQ